MIESCILISLVIVFFLLLNFIVIKSHWYQMYFEDVLKFRNIPADLKIANIGSNISKFGFLYPKGIGANFAVGPQTHSFDLAVLKQFINKMASDSKVIIVVSPLSSILKEYTSVTANDKYHLFLDPNLIPNYSKKVKIKMKLFYYFPILLLALNPRLIKQILHLRKPLSRLDINPMSDDELKEDAKKWINGWMKQFNLTSLNDPVSSQHQYNIEYNQAVLNEMITLCNEHSVEPVLVLLPTTSYLRSYFTKEFKANYILDFISPFTNEGIRLLNYIDHPDFKDSDYYFNSFFLNSKGRLKLTNKVLKDLSVNN